MYSNAHAIVTLRKFSYTLLSGGLTCVFNPLYNYGFFHLVRYNKLGIVHGTYLGVSGYNLKKKVLYHFSEDLLYL